MCAVVAEMKIDMGQPKTFYGTKHLIECLSPFSYIDRSVLTAPCSVYR